MYSYDRTRTKIAALQDGPVGRVLAKSWSQMHDVEYDLEQTLRGYFDAAHFMGGPAERDAKAMIAKIQAAVKELDHITKQTFNDLIDDEADFVKRYGEPSTYSDEMRKKTFPR